MAPELVILIISAASIAFVHTLLGPDHYVPFIAMAKARGWSLPKTLRVVLLCGSGHLVGSVVLGGLGIVAGIELTRLEWIESQRGAASVVSEFGIGQIERAYNDPDYWRNVLRIAEFLPIPSADWAIASKNGIIAMLGACLAFVPNINANLRVELKHGLDSFNQENLNRLLKAGWANESSPIWEEASDTGLGQIIPWNEHSFSRAVWEQVTNVEDYGTKDQVMEYAAKWFSYNTDPTKPRIDGNDKFSFELGGTGIILGENDSSKTYFYVGKPRTLDRLYSLSDKFFPDGITQTQLEYSTKLTSIAKLPSEFDSVKITYLNSNTILIGLVLAGGLLSWYFIKGNHKTLRDKEEKDIVRLINSGNTKYSINLIDAINPITIDLITNIGLGVLIQQLGAAVSTTTVDLNTISIEQLAIRLYMHSLIRFVGSFLIANVFKAALFKRNVKEYGLGFTQDGQLGKLEKSPLGEDYEYKVLKKISYDQLWGAVAPTVIGTIILFLIDYSVFTSTGSNVSRHAIVSTGSFLDLCHSRDKRSSSSSGTGCPSQRLALPAEPRYR